jgi:hypothetical protein
MREAIANPLAYYDSQSDITDPRAYARLFENLPTTLPELCHLIQGIVIHPYEAHLYGVKLPRKRLHELDTRKVALLLARIHELDSRSLAIERSPDKRLVGNCRDFATILCAILRYQGVPARVRSGFATYFEPDFFTDHVLCEYWKREGQRWALADAQIDDVQRQAYQVEVDTYDLPRDAFLLAGKGWQVYRSGGADPNRFGISSSGPRGISFIRSGLVRDLAALNKQELLCQDVWGLGEVEEDDRLSEGDLTLLDRAAALTLADSSSFPELCTLYESDTRLRVPPVIKCYTQAGVRIVNLTAEEEFS